MKKIILSSLAVLMTMTMFSQKGKVLEGDWKSISDIQKYDLEFDYSNVAIPEFEKEIDYINQKIKEKEEDEPGTGEIWKQKYFSDRENHFEPKFATSFNKRDDQKVSKDFDDATHIMKVVVNSSYNGWNVGVMRKAARIDATISVYNKADNNQIFSVAYEDVRGADALGYDFESHVRVAEAYAKLAKSFMRDLKKKG